MRKRFLIPLMLSFLLLFSIKINEYIHPVFPEAVKIKVQGIYFSEWGGGLESWEGSAVFIDDNLLLTAGHCVKDANNITIVYADGRECKAASWYLLDEYITDLGIIRVDTPEIEPKAVFSNPKVGESVIVIGNPFGYWPVRTEGIISAVNIDEDFFGEKNLVLTDAAINPGNSGCPVYNKRGYILGIVVGAIRGAQGNNFIVPAKICKIVIDKYKIEKELEEMD